MTMFMPRTASVPGRSHRRHNEPCQDSAVALEDDDFAIVAVSDGVGNPLSRIGRGGASTQVGAGLTAFAAAHAAFRHLQRGGDMQAVGRVVQEALKPLLRAVVDAVGRDRAELLLPATLVLGVLRDREAEVWVAGDGEAFVAAEDGAASISDRHTQRVAGGYLWQKLGRSVSGIPFEMLDNPNLLLPQLVLRTEGPVLGIYVATDGFVEAEGARLLLQVNPDSKVDEIEPALLLTKLAAKPTGGAEEIQLAAEEFARGEVTRAAERLRSLAERGMTQDDASVAWANNIQRKKFGLDLIEQMPRRAR